MTNRRLQAILPFGFVTVILLLALGGGCGGSSSSSSGGATPTPTPTGGDTKSRALFSSDRDTGGTLSQVYVINLDAGEGNSGITRVMTVGADELACGWSRNGGLILFSSNRNNGGGINNRDLYSVAPDGSSSLSRITNDTSKNSVDGAWSPTEDLIVFAQNGVITRVAPNGSSLTPITPAGYSDAAAPVWSPDGTKIAFVAHPNGSATDTRSIYVMAKDGTGLQPLTNSNEFIRRVAWSPNGATLAFDSSLNTGGTQASVRHIYTINAADGSGRTQLTGKGTVANDQNASDLSPVWKPDSSAILFSSNRDHGGGAGGTNAYELYRMNPDGSNVKQITTTSLNPFAPPTGWKPVP